MRPPLMLAEMPWWVWWLIIPEVFAVILLLGLYLAWHLGRALRRRP